MGYPTVEPIQSSLFFPAQPISEEVLLEKYSKGNEKTIADVNRRVAKALAKVEPAEQQSLWEDQFLETLEAGFSARPVVFSQPPAPTWRPH
jgi:ribonucleoside-diphosphate reductase alpha chain